MAHSTYYLGTWSQHFRVLVLLWKYDAFHVEWIFGRVCVLLPIYFEFDYVFVIMI